MLRLCLVDQNPAFVEQIKSLIQRELPHEFDFLGEAHDLEASSQLLERHIGQMDLLILDSRLMDAKGIKMLDHYFPFPFAILPSARDADFARNITGRFQKHVCGFLDKNSSEFSQTQALRTAQLILKARWEENRPLPQPHRRITIHSTNRHFYVAPEGLMMVAGDRNYTEIFFGHTESLRLGRKQLTCSYNLSQWERMIRSLRIPYLKRVSRKHVVNTQFLTEWNKQENELILRDVYDENGKPGFLTYRAQIGPSYKQALARFFENLSQY